MSAFTLDPPHVSPYVTTHPHRPGRAGRRGQLSHLAFSSPSTEVMAESLAMTVVVAGVLSGPICYFAAAAVLLRALRTPIPRLRVRPFDGTARYMVDVLATFGAAAAIGGPAVTDQSTGWAAMVAAGLAARIAVGVSRQIARQATPAARLRLMVLRTGDAAQGLVRSLAQNPAFGIDPYTVDVPEDEDILDQWMDAVVESHAPDAVLIAGRDLSPPVRHALARHGVPLHVLVTPGRSWVTGSGAGVETLWSERVAAVPPEPTQRPSWVFRTVVERIIALLGVLVLSPLMLALAAGVRLSSPGPVLFRQTRVGLDGCEFTIFKFRSMPVEHETNRWNAAHDDEPTRLGRVMRDLSLDELPQLFNVIRGEMSLVGPRPELPRFVDLFEDTVEGYRERHRVPVGMTGWAQVHGLRGDTSLTDRVAFDNNYIDDWSIGRDLGVLVRTAAQLLPERLRSVPQSPEEDRLIDLTDPRDGVVGDDVVGDNVVGSAVIAAGSGVARAS